MGTFLVQQKGDKTFILLDKVPYIYLFYGDFLQLYNRNAPKSQRQSPKVPISHHMLPIYGDVHHCTLPYIDLYTGVYNTH